jgi:hypothetical protein
MAYDAADRSRTLSVWTLNSAVGLALAIFVSAYWWARDISSVSAVSLGTSIGAVLVILRYLSKERFPSDRVTGWLSLGTMICTSAQLYALFFSPRGVISFFGDNMMIIGCSAATVLFAGSTLFHFRLIK